MSALPEDHRWSASDYITWERQQDTKHELIDNYIVDMTGASDEHITITFNIGGLLHAQLKGKPCRGYTSDLRVQVRAEGTYTYPDVVVICGEKKFTDSRVDTLTNPTVLMEVLSPSTELIDRSRKLEQYQALPSVQAYLLIAQDKARIELYTRQEKGWLHTITSGLDAIVKIPAINCELPLAEVYDTVQFPIDDVEE